MKVQEDTASLSSARSGLAWWRELLYCLAFYVAYSYVRNTLRLSTIGVEHAYHNAQRVISLERAVGLFHEEGIQQIFLAHHAFMRFWNIYYGTLHFIVPIVALIFLYRRHPDRYPLWRNTLACTTALALIGFTLFPLMPPRLLDSAGPFGPGPFGSGIHYGFTDSLAVFGGLWSFDSATMQRVSNQFAAMPSLHFAWALWCFLVLYRHLKSPIAKVAVALYPWLTLFAIIVTANHYWLDALGGAIALALGYVLGSALTRLNDRRRQGAVVSAGDHV